MLDLDNRDRAFVIAEAGTAHAAPNPQDRLPKALRYVEAAAKAGADAVKFQWFSQLIGSSTMFCWIDGDELRSNRWLASEMPIGEWAQVKEFAEACGLVFLASTFQHSTVVWLSDLGVVATKVASRAAVSFPYNNKVPLPYLISTGMCDPSSGSNRYLLECEARYPSTSAWRGEHPGFSDHSGKPFLAIDAISRGCKLIEVHYRIDRVDAGPDLPATLSLDQLATVCEARDYWAGRKAAV
jgi:N-acetylneuraminate synthase